MKKVLAPVSWAMLSATLAACGGESNVINENPVVKPIDTGAVGCTVSSNASCFPFVLEYPVAGLQYTCSSDQLNIFKTKLDGNIVTGGCNKTDQVTLFLNTANNTRIELGRVNLSDLGQTSTDRQPVHLPLLKLAQGLTGKAPSQWSTSDPTVQVAIQLVKIFQAIGSQKLNYVVGDIQPITLDSSTTSGLSAITTAVGLDSFQNGQYATILKPWIDVSQISDATAFDTLKKAMYISQGAIYQADLPTVASVNQGMIGTANNNAQQAFIGTFFVMTDRQGYAHGYGVQWRGTPTQGTATNTAAVTLVSTTNPLMMYANTQSAMFDALTQRISGFNFLTMQNENLTLTQGRLLNDYMAAGSDALYRQITATTVAAPSDELTAWKMPTATGTYTGSADIVKAYSISYLDNRVFKSISTVPVGTQYYFPMYATLNFKFATPSSGSTPTDVKLGIVIDENGDIRTDMRANSAGTNDMSGQCGTVADSKAAQFVDNYGVAQYRIGTVAATNYQPTQNDLSIAPRIILAGKMFGDLDGVMLGLSGLINGTTNANTGVKLNLYGLYSNPTGGNINLTNYTGGVAQWANIFNSYKAIYAQTLANTTNPSTSLTSDEQKQINRLNGTVSIELASCYVRAKTK